MLRLWPQMPIIWQMSNIYLHFCNLLKFKIFCVRYLVTLSKCSQFNVSCKNKATSRFTAGSGPNLQLNSCPKKAQEDSYFPPKPISQQNLECMVYLKLELRHILVYRANSDALFDELCEEWNSMPERHLVNLARSIMHRVAAERQV